ncbi:LacI family DNA-binding transcriptional regulator [Jannaschia pohangensis]|uniref:Transcriptional regulator, LacI family n=1 Tax=Jannaschia pohangensis TaxID=390807 RepID=A0A1I3P1N5_9RHOB|nr:LacI family DNA-binding transcriptional regulator [Jannaschia pohangensis]SFJ15272.1 transcriptional regulator, LacI family [Jannaschia pohangensis]
MQRSIRMKDVARAAGVSVMTVSRAFRADSSVKSNTRARIMKAADDLGYVFDSTAASLRSQRTDFVAVIIPSLNNANFAETVGGLSDGLAESGLQVLLGYTGYDIAAEERLVEQMLRRRPEAIVVTGGRHSDRTIRLLRAAGIPVVETWDLPDDPIDHVVGFSNAATTQVMVDHLVGVGYRRIAFIGGDRDGDTRGADRRRGFLAAMASHGLPVDRLVGAGDPPISMQHGADAMARLLDGLPETEAVICVSDLSAFGALAECQRRGLDVPGDIAIAGFGAYEIAGVCHPTLTTIDPQSRRIGARAAEVILGVLDAPGAPRRIAIDPRLIPGGTTRNA